ncbi:uncharacterized protein BKCO1_37000120 [Diplodia corticola]|uniref:Uncharacterized protein n=1 Tax=Diplodia corticola TaxID=236234 RepID=A0A1J9QW61_9PEZI|nr:uncharacterized protein BKCO1_37000120 [Diplodia corticola]OJD32617.1 hypothetical protein BKCO1_37000120 [Diplodia corticola]
MPKFDGARTRSRSRANTTSRKITPDSASNIPDPSPQQPHSTSYASTPRTSTRTTIPANPIIRVYAPSPSPSPTSPTTPHRSHSRQHLQCADRSTRLTFALGLILGAIACGLARTIAPELTSIPSPYLPTSLSNRSATGHGAPRTRPQSFITPQHLAWISFVPSLCWADSTVLDRLPALDEVPGRELGVFGAEGLGPHGEDDGKGWKEGGVGGGLSEDEKEVGEVAEGVGRERRLQRCKEAVLKGGERMKELFDDGFTGGEEGVMVRVMTGAQRAVVKEVIRVAEESAAFECMTQREKVKWVRSMDEGLRVEERERRRAELQRLGGLKGWWAETIGWPY